MQKNRGIDVFVHGEFERNDMIEHLGSQLSGTLCHKTIGCNPMARRDVGHQNERLRRSSQSLQAGGRREKHWVKNQSRTII